MSKKQVPYQEVFQAVDTPKWTNVITPTNRIMPTVSWFMRDCSNYFTGASQFAREALTLVTDPEDPSIAVKTHALNAQAQQFGHRSFLVHRRLFTDPSAMWHIVAEEWRDLIDTTQAMLIYAPTPPQLEDEKAIRLILIERPVAGCVPVLASCYLPPDRIDAPPWLLGTYVHQLPTPTTAEHLFRHIPNSVMTRLSKTDGHIWCEERYQSYDQQIDLQAGTHILIYGRPPEVGHQESAEEEIEAFMEDSPLESYNRRSSPSWYTIIGVLGLNHPSGIKLLLQSMLCLVLYTADHHVPLSTERSSQWSQGNRFEDGNSDGCIARTPRVRHFSRPDSFYQLPPPGNGMIGRVKKWTLVDLRTQSLDCLDDFAISNNIITLTDYKAPLVKCDLPLRFGQDDSYFLLTPWPTNVIRPLSTELPNLPELCAAFLEAAIPFEEDSLVGVDVYVDGSARKLDDGSSIAGYGAVLIGLHPTGYSSMLWWAVGVLKG